MSALVLDVLPGILAGALFRLQTLMILASAVLVEAAVFFMQSGAPAGLSWLLVSQCALLQFGYLGAYICAAFWNGLASRRSQFSNQRRTDKCEAGRARLQSFPRPLWTLGAYGFEIARIDFGNQDFRQDLAIGRR